MSLFSSSDKPESSKISVIAQIRAKSGHEAEAHALLQQLVEPSRQEPGCIQYDVLQDLYYPGSFFTHEQWETEAALDTHLALHKEGLNKLKALLREDLRISILKLL